MSQLSGSPDLKTGTVLDVLSLAGNTPERILRLNKCTSKVASSYLLPKILNYFGTNPIQVLTVFRFHLLNYVIKFPPPVIFHLSAFLEGGRNYFLLDSRLDLLALGLWS